MPSAFIEFPLVYPQTKPFVLKKYLVTIAEERIQTVSDKHDTLIGGGQHKPDHAMSIARILAVHYGYLPDGFAKEVLGVDTADLTKYGQMQKSIMTELYGKSSFLYEYVRGEVSADACATAISNWDLCARQCEFEVDGESEEQRANRIADRDRYRQAIVQLQGKIREVYEAGIVNANELIKNKHAKTFDKFVARQKITFFEQKRDEVLKPCFTNLDLISNVRELEMIKPRPLFARKDSERDYFWKKRINGDLITTVFRLAKGMVDLRTHGPQRLGSGLDNQAHLDNGHHAPQHPMLRASFEVKLDRPSMNAAIRDLVKHVDEPADTWHWKKVPVTTATKKHAGLANGHEYVTNQKKPKIRDDELVL
ncbi:unnamed protein product [Alternaria alternata]